MTHREARERTIAQLTREGLDYQAIATLLRCATTIHRLAELACSSEAADRDRIPCPATRNGTRYYGPCLCDQPDGGHETIPRIRLQDWNAERRATHAVPAGWIVETAGDPRGYTLRVIPPSYAERNAGRDRFNRDSIGIPAGPSGLRF